MMIRAMHPKDPLKEVLSLDSSRSHLLNLTMLLSLVLHIPPTNLRMCYRDI